jgi:hypothetical protein
MQATTFDGMSRNLSDVSNRRGFLRLLGGVVAFGAGSLALVGPEESVAKKKKKRKRRQPIIIADPGPTGSPLGALGCTLGMPYDTRCPHSTDPNHYCTVSITGAPLCGTSVKCFACAADADCVQFTGNARARCAVVPLEGGCLAQNSRHSVVVP